MSKENNYKVLEYLETKDVISMVCQDSNYNNIVIGCVVYKVYKRRNNNLKIIIIKVFDDYATYRGIGTFMLNKIKEKIRAKENWAKEIVTLKFLSMKKIWICSYF